MATLFSDKDSVLSGSRDSRRDTNRPSMVAETLTNTTKKRETSAHSRTSAVSQTQQKMATLSGIQTEEDTRMDEETKRQFLIKKIVDSFRKVGSIIKMEKMHHVLAPFVQNDYLFRAQLKKTEAFF